MKLPVHSVIAPAKLTEYLLKRRDVDDKSGLLALAGYTQMDADRLENDIRTQLLSLDAEPLDVTDYCVKHRIRGVLTGPNGKHLRVSSIWATVHTTGETRFITLYPDQR
jgi:hypothetical protein